MGKNIIEISTILLIALCLAIVTPAAKAESVAGESAQLNYTISPTPTPAAVSLDASRELQIKRTIIKRRLEKLGSPLADQADSFIEACRDYNLDCYLLPAISGLESTYGKFLMPGSYNPFGWGGGYIYFKNWDQGIKTVAKGLRDNYLNKGANDIGKIGRIYSESPTWSPRVEMLMAQFQKDEEENRLLFQLP